jgi:hypothetical protein
MRNNKIGGINKTSVKSRFRNATFEEALNLLATPKSKGRFRKKMFQGNKKLWEGNEYDIAEYHRHSQDQGVQQRAARQKPVTLPKLKFLEKKDED